MSTPLLRPFCDSVVDFAASLSMINPIATARSSKQFSPLEKHVTEQLQIPMCYSVKRLTETHDDVGLGDVLSLRAPVNVHLPRRKPLYTSRPPFVIKIGREKNRSNDRVQHRSRTHCFDWGCRCINGGPKNSKTQKLNVQEKIWEGSEDIASDMIPHLAGSHEEDQSLYENKSKLCSINQSINRSIHMERYLPV